jgi:hypothetical protein
MKSGKGFGVFVIQDVKNSGQKWMTILDPESNSIHESHLVHHYEAESLIPPADWASPLRDLRQPDEKKRERLISSVLDRPPLTLEQLYALVGDADIPSVRFGGLKIGATMRETMEQLVPETWSPKTREEVMAFLAWITLYPEPLDKDPVDFFDVEEVRWIPALRSLLFQYHARALSGRLQLPYVRRFWEYEGPEEYYLGAFTKLDRPKMAVVMKDPLLHIPSILHHYVTDLQTSGRLVTGLPVSRAQARRSKTMRYHRLLMVQYGVALRAVVNVEAIGLKRLAYIGSAYRWPHRHLVWNQPIGNKTEQRPRMVHEMFVPFSAVEKVRRAVKGLMQVDLYHRSDNAQVLDSEGVYCGNPKNIIRSLSRRLTEGGFRRFTGAKRVPTYDGLTDNDIRVLDFANFRLYLDDLELLDDIKSVGISRKEVRSTLRRLMKAGILYPIYHVQLSSDTKRFWVIGHECEGNMLSLAKSLSRNSETTMVMKCDGGRTVLTAGTLPSVLFPILKEGILGTAKDHELNVVVEDTVGRGGRFWNGLFQRLWKGDGVWDDDVSGFLSQARRKGKVSGN